MKNRAAWLDQLDYSSCSLSFSGGLVAWYVPDYFVGELPGVLRRREIEVHEQRLLYPVEEHERERSDREQDRNARRVCKAHREDDGDLSVPHGSLFGIERSDRRGIRTSLHVIHGTYTEVGNTIGVVVGAFSGNELSRRNFGQSTQQASGMDLLLKGITVLEGSVNRPPGLAL